MLTDTKVFPRDFSACSLFPELFQGRLPPLVIAGTDHSDVAQTVTNARGECHFKRVRVLGINGKECFLYLQSDWEHDSWRIFDSPMLSTSQSQGSQAVYYAAHERLGLLLQGLPENSETSCHDHLHVSWIEFYFRLAGNAVLHTDLGQFPLDKATPVVRPEVGHQLRTANQPVLVLLNIKEDPEWYQRWEDGTGHRYGELIPKVA